MAVKRRKRRTVKKIKEKLVVDNSVESNILLNNSGENSPQSSPINKVQIVQSERQNREEPAPIQKKSRTNFTPSKMISLRGKDPNKVYYGVNKHILGRAERKIDEGMVYSTDQNLVNASENIAMGNKLGSTVEIGDLVIMEASKVWAESRKAYYKNKIRGKKDLQQAYYDDSKAAYGNII